MIFGITLMRFNITYKIATYMTFAPRHGLLLKRPMQELRDTRFGHILGLNNQANQIYSDRLEFGILHLFRRKIIHAVQDASFKNVGFTPGEIFIYLHV